MGGPVKTWAGEVATWAWRAGPEAVSTLPGPPLSWLTWSCPAPSLERSLTEPEACPSDRAGGRPATHLLFRDPGPCTSQEPLRETLGPRLIHNLQSCSPLPGRRGLTVLRGDGVKPLIYLQLSSVTQSCPTLCDPVDHSTPGFPVHHQLPEFAQTRVHLVGEAIQPSHPLWSPSPPAFSLSQHQGLFP